MNLSIRTVKTEDAPALSDLFREFYKSGSNVAKMKKQIGHILNNSDYYVPVVCDDQRVVGTAMAILCHDLVGECNSFMLVENVVVDPEYRRRGVGTMLMKSIEQFAQRHGCKYIILVSEIERKESHDFYKSLGYTADQQGFKKQLMHTSFVT